MPLRVQFSDRGYLIEKSNPTAHDLKLAAAEASNNCRCESESPAHLSKRAYLLRFHFFAHHVGNPESKDDANSTP
jgi:hypothetical protein